MNVATLLGFVLGTSVLTWSVLSATANASIFWNPNGLAIVLGGVVAATLVCYPLKQVLHVFRCFVKVLQREDLPIANYLDELHYLGEQAMAGGALKLEGELKGIENFFLKDGLRMVVDHYPIEKIRAVMESTIRNTRDRELAEADVFRTMATLAPAFGMVGTLIGMIVMFQSMNGDLSGIGPAMATAMMTTFYGLLLANLLFNPIAIKMERRIDERVLLMTAITEGLLLVAKKTPPELALDELRSFVPALRWKDIGKRSRKPAPPAERAAS